MTDLSRTRTPAAAVPPRPGPPQSPRAPQAAGRIHTDFERGFIRAQTIGWQQLVEAGSLAEARNRGWLRSEGMHRVRGPFNLHINEELGLLVDGFETPATVLNPHNPRYYIDLVEGSNVSIIADDAANTITISATPGGGGGKCREPGHA